MRVMQPDSYYGRKADEYDRQRMHKPDWPLEQKAVADFVKDGPVLDCPIGTGRYVEIYKNKGLKVTGLDASGDMIANAKERHPDLVAHEGSVLDLPFRNSEFGTAVCSRLLNWLYPEDMAEAMGELKRVAKTVVCSIRTGEKGHHEHQANFTHSMEDFLYACTGYMIESRREIHRPKDGQFVFYKLRRPAWKDVHRQFEHHRDGKRAIVRLANDWCDNFGIPHIRASKGKVSMEYWSGDRIGGLLDRMAATVRADGRRNEIRTNAPPRFKNCPITIIRIGLHEAMLDGRRRSNVWRHQSGLHPVLVIEA